MLHVAHSSELPGVAGEAERRRGLRSFGAGLAALALACRDSGLGLGLPADMMAHRTTGPWYVKPCRGSATMPTSHPPGKPVADPLHSGAG